MSRIISAERIFRPDFNSENPPIQLKALRDACMETHQQCLSIVTRYIELDSQESLDYRENMALLLACAQVCQSVSTLIQFGSPEVVELLQACHDVCLSCARSCECLDTPTLEPTFGFACSQACRRCAEVCLSVEPQSFKV